MFAKLSIIFMILFQYIHGSPLEPVQGKYDVKDYLSSRIVGGEDAPEGYAPYMMALVVTGWMKSLVCGASILTDRHALSAAHCIDPFVFPDGLATYFQGVVGSNYWNAENLVQFKDYVIHSEWDWPTIKNDIGILITTEKIVFNERVSPIALSYEAIGGSVESFVTGWGLLGVWDWTGPYRLQLLHVTTLSNKECAKRIEEASQVLGSAPPVDGNIEICAFHSKGHGMCSGDSGSALVQAHSRRQVGVVSWGFPCALGAPDVFVRVSGFTAFIEDVLRKPVD